MKKTVMILWKVFSEPSRLWSEQPEEPSSLLNAIFPLALVTAAIPAISQLIGHSFIGMSLGPFGQWRLPFWSAILASVLFYVLLVGGLIGFGALIRGLFKAFRVEKENSLELCVYTAVLVTIPLFLGGLFLLYEEMRPLWFISGIFGVYLLKSLSVNVHGLAEKSSWQFSIMSFIAYYILILGISYTMYNLLADSFTPSIADILRETARQLPGGLNVN